MSTADESAEYNASKTASGGSEKLKKLWYVGDLLDEKKIACITKVRSSCFRLLPNPFVLAHCLSSVSIVVGKI